MKAHLHNVGWTYIESEWSEMDFKQMKKILYKYGEIPEQIKTLNTEMNMNIEQMIQSRNTLKANVIIDVPQGTGGISNPTLNAVVKVVDRYDQRIITLAAQINQLIDEKEKIDKLLNSLEPDQKKIIELRYVMRYSWYRISMITHYSRRQCFNIHNAAVEQLVNEYDAV